MSICTCTCDLVLVLTLAGLVLALILSVLASMCYVITRNATPSLIRAEALGVNISKGVQLTDKH